MFGDENSSLISCLAVCVPSWDILHFHALLKLLNGNREQLQSQNQVYFKVSSWKMAAVAKHRTMCGWNDVPCLLDEMENDDEEMMLCSSRCLKVHTTASMGEDVWRRLALPPTPPRSPTKSIGETTQNLSTVSERLQLVSESLDEFVDLSERIPCFDSISLRSKLIQDCMWNGTNKTDSSYIDAIYDTPCATPPPLDYSSNDCVDPTAVFPNPLNEENGQSQQEDTDEEIDVVSVDKPKPQLKRKLSEPNNKQSPKTSNKRILKRATSLPVTANSRSLKRVFDDSSSDASNAACANCEESDSDKRASHNVLERKRRNDLKSSFHTLRSYVPNLSTQEKAAKVIILKKATDYIHELRNDEDSLAKEKDDLKARQRELLEKFIKLKPKV